MLGRTVTGVGPVRHVEPFTGLGMPTPRVLPEYMSSQTLPHNPSDAGEWVDYDRRRWRNPDINAQDRYGQTRLHVACKRKARKDVDKLLTNGADPDVNDKDGYTPLHIAICLGHFKIVKTFLSHKVDIEHKTTEGYTSLHLACEQGHADIVNIMLDHKAKRHSRTLDGFTPLHLACRSGHDVVVKILLKRKADMKRATPDGTTPLHLACLYGHVNVVTILLSYRADVTKVTLKGHTSLHEACMRGHTKIVEMLLNHNVNSRKSRSPRVNTEAVTSDGHTALHLASYYGHSDIIAILLKRGANVQARDVDEDTPLHLCCFYGHNHVAQMLADCGTDIDTKDKLSYTPLHFACFNGHLDVAKFLITRGADKNIRTHQGYTSLQIACKNGHDGVVVSLLTNGGDAETMHETEGNLLHMACSGDLFFAEIVPNRRTCVGNHEDVVVFLLSRRVDVNGTNRHGNTPLHCMCSAGRNELVERMIKNGADIHRTNNDGDTALQLACSNGHVDVVATLLRSGSRPDERNNDGNTALHLASIKGHVNITALLVEHGSHPDIINNTGNTALHEASCRGYGDVVRCLLNERDTTDVKNRDGETPQDLAFKSNHQDIVQLLQIYTRQADRATESAVSTGERLSNVNSMGHSVVSDPLANKGEKNPDLCRKWQFSASFTTAGGILQGEHSDVWLKIPQGAVRPSDTVNIKGAVSGDLQLAYDALRGETEGTETIVSPIVEYSTGRHYRFQKPVLISLPHFLPETFCPDSVHVYKLTKTESGRFDVQRLKLRRLEDDDNDQTGEFTFSGSERVEICTYHFCTTVVVSTNKPPSDLTLKLCGRYDTHGDTSGAFVSLFVWDKRMTCQDTNAEIMRLIEEEKMVILRTKNLTCAPDLAKFCLIVQLELDDQCTAFWVHRKIKGTQCFPDTEVVDLEHFEPCSPNTHATRVDWSLHNAPGTSPSHVLFVVRVGYTGVSDLRALCETLPKKTLFGDLTSWPAQTGEHQDLRKPVKEPTLPTLRPPVQVSTRGEHSEGAVVFSRSAYPDNIHVVNVNSEKMHVKFEDMVSGLSYHEVYPMRQRIRGVFLLINNKTFGRARTELEPREGTEADARALLNLFHDLGFLVEERSDCTAEKMKSAISKLLKRDHSRYDCLACAILSHGQEGAILGVDGKRLEVDAIKRLVFAHTSSITLCNKPKLFFIQACQGVVEDAGNEVEHPSGIAGDMSENSLPDVGKKENPSGHAQNVTNVPGDKSQCMTGESDKVNKTSNESCNIQKRSSIKLSTSTKPSQNIRETTQRPSEHADVIVEKSYEQGDDTEDNSSEQADDKVKKSSEQADVTVEKSSEQAYTTVEKFSKQAAVTVKISSEQGDVTAHKPNYDAGATAQKPSGAASNTNNTYREVYNVESSADKVSDTEVSTSGACSTANSSDDPKQKTAASPDDGSSSDEGACGGDPSKHQEKQASRHSSQSVKIEADVPRIVSTDGPKKSKIPSTSDLLIAFPTGPGFAAYRDSARGSIFIQTIVKVFSEYACKEHLSDLMIKVGGEVSRMEANSGRHKQQPWSDSSLRKKLYFFPGLHRTRLP